MKIIRAESTVVIDAAGRLFEEYAASLPFDLCFQNFEQELLGLPGEYAPPTGCLLVAILNEDVAAGCVALRQLEAGIGEMKRLFVRPAHRGIGLGKRLAREILTEAVGL